MLIIGCDYHPSFQQIAFVDTDTGELQERRLEHREEAEKFYRGLGVQRMKASSVVISTMCKACLISEKRSNSLPGIAPNPGWL
jgi:hypothetical protein